MLTSCQLARELINRKNSTQGLDTSITTSSYEMINPDQETDVDTSDDSPRRHFWGLHLRRKPQHRPQDKSQQEQGAIDGRRVVSEPVMSGRRGISVLRRFRFGRQDIEEDEHEGDLTISTETVSHSHTSGCPTDLQDVSIEPNEEEEISTVRLCQCSPNVRSRQSTAPLAQWTQVLPSSLLRPLLRHQLHPLSKGLDNDRVIQLPNLLSRGNPRLANLHLSLIRHLILPLEAPPSEQSPPKLDSRM